jgi:hypothetical protein
MHFGKPAAFTIAFALILFLTMQFGNRFSGNRFFYREEPYLAAFGVLAASWPAGLVVMGFVLGIGVVLQAFLALVGSRGRMPLIWFWLPAALVAIVFGDIMVKWLGLSQFRV